MEVQRATADVLLGASMRQIAADCRQELITVFGLRPENVTPATFRDEVAAFMRQLARHLGDRHTGDPRVGQALREWVAETEHYEAWDALLSGFSFEGREGLVRRGRILFPGPLTAHWAEA
ncbi:MAG: hypothetical protein Q7T30_01990 [Planctomycetota bacterium]|nr:hypothetical protein [Planctomycetota bacterium]